MLLLKQTERSQERQLTLCPEVITWKLLSLTVKRQPKSHKGQTSREGR